MKQIGSGGEATVFGPVTFSELKSLLQTRQIQRLDPDQKFIVKVYDKKQDFGQKHRSLIQKLKKIPYPDRVILPLLRTRLPRSKIQTLFPKVAQSSPTVDFFDVEIQKFGGKDLFGLLFEPVQKNIPASVFFRLWNDIKKILANCFVWIVRHDLIITDIKPENMVIDQQKLMLIDLSAYLPEQKTRTLTMDIQLLPSQYFHQMFRGVSEESWEKRKKRFVEKSSEIYDSPKTSAFHRVLHQIHNQAGTFEQAFRQYSSSPIDRQDGRLFLVVYPLFVLMLRLIYVNKIETTNEAERQKVDAIRRFCIDVLKRRGKILVSSDRESDMKRFLKEMNLSSISPK